MNLIRRVSLTLLFLSGLVAPTWAQQNPVTVYGFGANVDTNTGTTSARTLRVVPVTDNAWLVQGIVAHDAVYSGNPLPLGCYASASAPTDVTADGDMVRMWCLRNGALSVNITNATLAATQSGTWSVRAQDGSGNALTSAVRGSERALSVQLVDGSGTQITSFGGSGGTASNYGSAFPASGTAAGFSDGTNMQGARVFDADSGAGSQYVAGVNLRKIASGGSVEAGTSSDPLRVDPTGTTTQPVSLATGSNLAGYVGTQNTFGTKTTLTTTNFTSLASNTAANCTTGCWQSASVTTSGAKDMVLRFQSKGQAGSTGYAEIYVCASMSSDSTFSGGCSGTEGTYTVANIPNNMRYLGSLLYNGTTAIQGVFSLLDVFATLPGKVALVIKNMTGGTVSTTAGDHVFDYQLVN